mmetsp:Transcript_51776/g.66314  ORF Transcript_51776/g.66314 Transcript_51776/m.66314 type:complete len:258 (+) Transcript_51776:77-850(+)|eukprot:CAMPEP_0114360228 /NCGR_PEP_ID=MMETSP0101-20121206/23672_1 /TAXON_ID=38822 ORGANISM="Pteridomonas danica, Strain PT" /NCGR_SAMPLE_ID=MMETSP0101 /ASSEMBLY_ACC=CAM_ASM_000211 /LENGTH=257 /DNA_ID=CAMNT_0001504291 /DNA_START=10 /DNA_END=783 /DNA_ORIENTATION=+
MPTITITVSPIDRGWSMGDPLELEVDTTNRMDFLFKLIAKQKKIPKSRFVLKFPPSIELRWDKGLVGNKAPWSIRRCGIYQGLNIIIEPSFPLAWLWEPIQYYEDSYMDECVEVIKGNPDEQLSLQEIALSTFKPPPLFMTLRCFLRKYPEIFQMEINQNNNSGAGLVIVRLNKPIENHTFTPTHTMSSSRPSTSTSRASSRPSSRPSSRSGIISPPHSDHDDNNSGIVAKPPNPPVLRKNLTGTTHIVGVISPTMI